MRNCFFVAACLVTRTYPEEGRAQQTIGLLRIGCVCGWAVEAAGLRRPGYPSKDLPVVRIAGGGDEHVAASKGASDLPRLVLNDSTRRGHRPRWLCHGAQQQDQEQENDNGRERHQEHGASREGRSRSGNSGGGWRGRRRGGRRGWRRRGWRRREHRHCKVPGVNMMEIEVWCCGH